jgi:predicted esterase
MKIKEHHIQYLTSTRYTSFGNPEIASTLLVALHGYGQLAPYFIRKFTRFNPEEVFVVCPEAPHRFYQNGSEGRVGASWMTKEDRAIDIKNYLHYLHTLLNNILSKYTFEKKVLLGFSQGGATASRLNEMGKFKFDVFILWAAVYPPDMSSVNHEKIKSTKNYFVLGNKDEYISLTEGERQIKNLKSNGLDFVFKTFEGRHDIDFETLKQLL